MTDGRTRHHRQGRRGDRLALTRLVTAAGVQPLAGYLVSLLAAQLLEHYPPPLPGGTRASLRRGVLAAGGRVNLQVVRGDLARAPGGRRAARAD